MGKSSASNHKTYSSHAITVILTFLLAALIFSFCLFFYHKTNMLSDYAEFWRIRQAFYSTLVQLIENGYCRIELQRAANLQQLAKNKQERSELDTALLEFSRRLCETGSKICPTHTHLLSIKESADAIRQNSLVFTEGRNTLKMLQENHLLMQAIHSSLEAIENDFSKNVRILSILNYLLASGSCLLLALLIFFLFSNYRNTRNTIRNYLQFSPDILLPSSSSHLLSGTELEKDLDQFIQRIAKECQARENFISAMSHEIRTPMNGIIGFLSNLKETPLNDQQKQFLKIIESSARSLLHTINEILDFSKIRSGQMTLEEVAFDIRSLIEERVTLARQMAKVKNLKLILDFPGTDALIVRTDPGRLRQVLDNLLSNAVKFTERGEIVMEVCDIQAEDGMHTLDFAVKDSGIGISLNHQGKIFRPFEQADSSISRRFGGTGLGLPISASLVKLLGGELVLKSRPGEGSCFRFTLHLSSAKPEEQVRFSDLYKIDLPRTELKKNWALLVDDTPTNLFLLETICQSIGLPYRTAENGREAVLLCKQQHFDIIFMDIQMPIMNGYTAIQEIRKLPGSGTTSIIALTASAFQEDIDQALGAGSTGFIPKPFERDQLLICIADSLGITPHRELRESPDYQETTEAATVRRMHDFMQSQYQIGLGEIKMIMGQTLMDWRPLLDNLSAYSQSSNLNETLAILQRLKGQLAAIGLLDHSEQTVSIMNAFKNGNQQEGQTMTARLIQSLTAIFKLLEQNVTLPD